ncbi:hypothetical protein [Microbacterium sp. SSM24]|uniref:hypothetical protein n=1 Tax=Microbacterium sp. SSM24 TaxID=2991714 RepID=UPI002225D675|nr:hypothetical protein [Microbacterium sp. SSM24]MCW3493886.1 hypothetical protein [Microbacterium sp. SSM24]
MWMVHAATCQLVLGAQRVDLISERVSRVREWSDRLAPVRLRAWELPRVQPDDLERTLEDDEEWIAITLSDGSVLASNDFSELGRLRRVAAVIYPEVDSRLWAWWLTHAWSSTELATESADALARWSLASAATLTRSLLESVAAFSYETRQISNSWRRAKKIPGSEDRPLKVRQEMGPTLIKAFRGTRMAGFPEYVRAPNVLTWIERLGKDAGNPLVTKWYEQLSEAAHPAFFARTLYSSSILSHPSGAKADTFFSRSPIAISGPADGGGGVEVVDGSFSRTIADVWLFCSSVLLELLPESFKLPADFSLTSRAADLAASHYLQGIWADEPCACGCGGRIDHKWSYDFPGYRLSSHSPVLDS